MARATRSPPRAALLALLLLAAPAAAAEPIAFTGQQQLYHEVQPSPRGATFAFRASFAVDQDGPVYLKVVPSPTNPAFGNGTEGRGWWTEAALVGPAAHASGGSNGSTVVELGPAAPGANYTLHLNVTVPPGALAAPAELRLRYALAIRAAAGSGSGGQLDPSLSLNPRIVVSPTAADTVPHAEGSRPAWLLPGGIALGAALAAAAVAGALLAVRSRRRRG